MNEMICHICGAVAKGTPECAVCHTDFTGRSPEIVLTTDPGMYWKNPLRYTTGILVRTDRRLVFIKADNTSAIVGAAVGGLVGALVAGAISGKGKGKLLFSIPLEEISGVEEFKYGFRKGMLVHTREQVKYKLFPDTQIKWSEMMDQYRMTVEA